MQLALHQLAMPTGIWSRVHQGDQAELRQLQATLSIVKRQTHLAMSRTQNITDEEHMRPKNLKKKTQAS